jgi:GTP-binding protein
LKIDATFVTSAAGADDFPRENLAAIALVGRSNVGKSTLLNALVRRRVARTSAAPGKTRLANVYRVDRGGHPALFLVDLPGYGYARGDNGDFESVTRAFFEQESGGYAAVLLVDARHPGLENDLQAWHWLQSVVDTPAVVATKIDKLARGQRIRAMRELESVFDAPVMPCSAVTGEGLDDLWKLMDRLANSSRNLLSPSRQKATARQHRKR